MSQATTTVKIKEVQEAHQWLVAAENHRNAGEFDHAQEICQELIAKHPNYVMALSMLGTLKMQTMLYAEALPYLVRAAMLAPNHVSILTNLARVYLELKADDLAERTLQRALELEPDRVEALYVLGDVQVHRTEYASAAKIFERILAKDAHHVRAAATLSNCYMQLNRHDDAASILKSCQDAPMGRHQKALVLHLQSQLPNNESKEELLEEIIALGGRQDGDVESTVAYQDFARANILDNLCRHKEAWDCLVAANEPIATQYKLQRQQFAERAEMLLKKAQAWTPPSRTKAASKSAKGPLSVFILGPSRSGKTSLEQMLDSLAGANAGTENVIVRDTARKTAQQADLLSVDLLADLPEQLNSSISEIYQSQLEKRAEGVQVFFNTHPGVITDVGRLVDCVPHSKFIFIKRNEDDVAFRIFGRYYSPSMNPYVYGVKDIYDHISQYNQMIDNWMDKLGSQAMLISYEDMVENPVSTMEKVAKFCGLNPPSSPPGQIVDDRDCAAPYRKLLATAKTT